jgi:hypothetical protein
MRGAAGAFVAGLIFFGGVLVGARVDPAPTQPVPERIRLVDEVGDPLPTATSSPDDDDLEEVEREVEDREVDDYDNSGPGSENSGRDDDRDDEDRDDDDEDEDDDD